MSKKFINQKDILNLEFLDIINYNYIFNNTPIKRFKKKIDKKNALENLEKKINSIEDCVSKTDKKIVFGEGNINSKIMVIEDAPGELEENNKKPFMGQSGKLLDKMLNAIELERKNIYLTSFFKFRSFKKIDAKKYFQFLKEQISIINPRIIVLMGDLTEEFFFNKIDKFYNNKEIWKQIELNQNKIYFISSFHPSNLIKDSKKKRNSWEHLKLIKKKLEELNLIT